MTATVLAVAAALCWAAATFRLPTLRREPVSAGQRSLSIALFALAVALTAQVPPVYVGLGRLTGVPNVAVPVGHASVLVAAWAATVLLLHSTYPSDAATRRARRRFLLLVVCVAGMVALFLASKPDHQVLTYAAYYGRKSLVAEYYLIFLSLLAAASVDITRLCWRYAHLAQRDILRLGLHLIAASGVVALAYIGYKATNVIADRFALRLPLGYEPNISRSLISLGTVLVLSGTTVSMWGSRLGLEKVYSWWRNYRSYRRLAPLWWALCGATPEIALYPPSSRLSDVFALRDLAFRLHRRVIEVRDGWLSLRPYLNPEVAETARRQALEVGCTGDQLQARVHAALLADAVAAKLAGRRAGAGMTTSAMPGGGDPRGELAWLEQVARAYSRRTSPIRQEARRRVAINASR